MLAGCGGGAAADTTSSTESTTTESSGGDEATDVRGSCVMRAMFTREQYEGPVEAAQLESRRTGCADAGATWSDGPCPTTDLIAGCRMAAPPETGSVAGTAMMVPFYVGSPAFCQAAQAGESLAAQCTERSGTYFEGTAPVPVCP